MKPCIKPKFKGTCSLINDTRAFVNTVHRSASLNQDWNCMCSMSLVGEVPKLFDSTFLTTSRLACKVDAVLQDFAIRHNDKVTTKVVSRKAH